MAKMDGVAGNPFRILIVGGGIGGLATVREHQNFLRL